MIIFIITLNLHLQLILLRNIWANTGLKKLCVNSLAAIPPPSSPEKSNNADFMVSLSDDKQAGVIYAFNTTSRY